MEANMKLKHFDKAFANYKIEWKIETFCFAIRPDINYIHSSDFNLQETKWKMILEVKGVISKDDCVSLYLERLSESDGPNVVWVDGEVVLKAGPKQYTPIEFYHYFERKSRNVLILQSARDILENLPAFEPDTLHIACNLLLRKQDKFFTVYKHIRNHGLRTLSDDLNNMLNQKMFQDVTLRVGGKDIKAHKVILSRNKVLKCLIETAETNVVELQNLHYEAVSRFVSFVYSGNMEFILRNPSIAMYKCVDFFDCDILMPYFSPEQLNLHTHFEMEEHEFHWVIDEYADKSSKKARVSSPCFNGINGSVTWKLILDTNEEKNNGFVSVIAEIVKGIKPSYFCLEFAVEDDNGEVFFARRVFTGNRCYHHMGVEKFVRSSCLKHSDILFDDKLIIAFKVKTSEGLQKSSVGTRMLSFTTISKNSFEELSIDMRSMLDDNKFFDVILVCGNKYYKAHKCILAARSPTFFRMIQKKVTDTNVLPVSNIKSTIIPVLLGYIYSGVLKSTEISNLLNLYEVPKTFAVSGLKEECIKCFSEVSHENRAAILDMAERSGDNSLLSAMTFASINHRV